MLTFSQVSQHASPGSCWVVIHGQAYDVTGFLPQHPGGASAILRCAGKDATEEYDPIHPRGALSQLPPEAHLGAVDLATFPKPAASGPPPAGQKAGRPPLEALITLGDFEQAAEGIVSAKAWAYFRSAADDEAAHDANVNCFDSVCLRPHVLRDVTRTETSTTMLGQKVAAPIFVCPAALARLAHPDGEKAIARAAGKAGLIYVLSNSASCSPDEVAETWMPGQVMWFQLYVNKDRRKSEAQLKRVEELGYKAIVVTVDVPFIGKRVRDERVKLGHLDLSSGAGGQDAGQPASSEGRPQPAPGHTEAAASVPGGGAMEGVAQITSHYLDPSLSWQDLAWIRRQTKLPLVVKGIQTWEDALRCVSEKVDAIVVSNHGGRQCSSAPSTLDILTEIHLNAPSVFRQLEVYADGGFRHGTAVLKALALGVRACGIGRPALYSVAYGEPGVERMLGILKQEVEGNAKLLGVQHIQDVGLQHIRGGEVDKVKEGVKKRSSWFGWTKL